LVVPYLDGEEIKYINKKEGRKIMKKILVLTVGLPRSGKSTWAMKQGHPVVNRDAIRLALHGQPYIQAAEDAVSAIETYMVKALFLAGHNLVIVDATHMKEKYRERWESEDWTIQLQRFDTSREVCINRATASGKAFLIPIIEEMDEEKKNMNDLINIAADVLSA
jgi:predicted kinase